ncbi:hypothetical protein AB0G73_27800 [Streptomyces sp. NPDC020719]|uniref:hypothetical protein n=1 Tax=Streptomyces sp. NPDC020719 TaxID=3154896 RepID=UPI0033E9A59F
MNLRGVPPRDFQDLTSEVSDDLYDGNVIVAPDAHAGGNRSTVARLRVVDCRGPGARTAASGRYGPYACWHAYRDVMFRLFCAYPSAIVRTCLATYRGIREFEDRYPVTAYRNLGSELRPQYIRELCVVSGCGEPLEFEIWELPSWPRADDVLARMRVELAAAEDTFPTEEFCGPVSLRGAPDLAYSHCR